MPATRLMRARPDVRSTCLRTLPCSTFRLMCRSRAALSMGTGSLGPQRLLLSSTSSASMSTKWQQSTRGTFQGVWRGNPSPGHGWNATTEQWLTQPTLGSCSLQQAPWRLRRQANVSKAHIVIASLRSTTVPGCTRAWLHGVITYSTALCGC